MANRGNVQDVLDYGIMPKSSATPTVVFRIGDKGPNPGSGAWAYGTSVPSSVAGYMPGSFFQDTSTGYVYINTGSATVCTFTRMTSTTAILTTGNTWTGTQTFNLAAAITVSHSAGQILLSGAGSNILLSGANSTLKLIGIGANLWVGSWASATAGSGVVLGSLTKALDVCCDDGSAALTAGTYRAARFRVLQATAASADISLYGAEAHVKSVANYTGVMAGLWGYVEAAGTASVGGLIAGVRAMIDVPANTAVGSGTAAGISIGSISLAGTHTAKITAINVEAPLAGAWDFVLALGAGTATVAAGKTLTSTYAIPVRTPDGSTAYIFAGTYTP